VDKLGHMKYVKFNTKFFTVYGKHIRFNILYSWLMFLFNIDNPNKERYRYDYRFDGSLSDVVDLPSAAATTELYNVASLVG